MRGFSKAALVKPTRGWIPDVILRLVELETDLSRANLDGANLSHGQQQLDRACGADATLPPDLTLKPCSSTEP